MEALGQSEWEDLFRQLFLGSIADVLHTQMFTVTLSCLCGPQMKGTLFTCYLDPVVLLKPKHYSHLKNVESIMCYLLRKLFIDQPLETATLILCLVTSDVRPVVVPDAAEDDTLKRTSKASGMDSY